jgi:hypothetical protein
MTARSSAFAEALEARVAGLGAGAWAQVRLLARALPRRREAVWARLQALTQRLRLAGRQSLGSLAAAGASPREQGEEALRWLGGVDRDRAATQTAVWALLREAREGEAAARAAVNAEVARRAALRERVAARAEQALGEARAGAGVKLATLPEGRRLAARLERSVAAARTGVEESAARARRDLERLSASALVDREKALTAFEEALANEALGPGVSSAPGARPERRPARRPAQRLAQRPQAQRKRAGVPRFLLDRFYRSGGLRAVPGGVELVFVNPLAFCILQGGDPLIVDGAPHPRERTLLRLGDQRLGGAELSASRYLKFPKAAELRVTLEGLSLAPGRHRIECALELRKLGWVDLLVEDVVR